MKLLYIDLETLNSTEGARNEWVSSSKIRLLNQLVAGTNIQVVLTSWKRDSLQLWNTYLKKCGAKFQIAGFTPSIPRLTKGEEILVHLYSLKSEVSYAILDRAELPGLKTVVVSCEGISPKNMREAKVLLDSPPVKFKIQEVDE